MEETFTIDPRRRDYELAAVLSPSVSDAERDAFMEKIQRLVTDAEGELIAMSPPKPYTLAYPIKKERQAIFRTLVFRGPVDLPERIAEAVRHETILLRHFVLERQKIQEGVPARKEAPSISAAQEQHMEEQIKAALGENA